MAVDWKISLYSLTELKEIETDLKLFQEENPFSSRVRRIIFRGKLIAVS